MECSKSSSVNILPWRPGKKASRVKSSCNSWNGGWITWCIGWALQGQGRYEEAEVALLDGIVVNSDYGYTYETLGPVQLALGKYDEALATLQTADRLVGSSWVLVDLGAAQALTGDLDGALGSIERALELGFDSFDAIEGSPYYESLRGDPRLQSLLDEYRQ